MEPEKNSGEWAVLATFSWLQEALLLRSRLEGTGIAARIPEEHIASINPVATGMRVRVMVPSSKLERAREILEQPQEGPSGEEACPSCGSLESRRKGSWLKNLVALLSGILVFIPVRRSDAKVCGGCGRLRR